MEVTQYIGARYVPVFAGIWDNTKVYEPLTIVMYQGNSYTSKQSVPVGVDITNEVYWAETGNYNAQVEQYRQTVLTYDSRISTVEQAVNDLESFDVLYDVCKEISPLYLGNVVYSQDTDSFSHPSGICSIGQTQIIASHIEPYDNASLLRTISIQNNADYATFTAADLAHCNSLAYNENTESIFVAPVFYYVHEQEGVQSYKAAYVYEMSLDFSVITRHDAPKWIMAVSFDSVKNIMYALAFDGTVYSIDENYNFTSVTVINRPYKYNQDFAVHDGNYVLCAPSGYMLIGNLSTSKQDAAFLNHIDSSYLFEYAELDSIEFDEQGHLLSVAHVNQLDERLAFIYEIPVNSNIYYYLEKTIESPYNIGAVYSLYIDQNSHVLRTDGVTEQTALKSINFLNCLADDTQRSLILLDDYETTNLRIGNDTFNWISLNNHSLTVKNTFTVQTALIINGGGDLYLYKPIAITFGIARFGLSGGVTLHMDTYEYLLNTNPVGAFITFGSITNSDSIKLYSSATDAIESNEVYILGNIVS